jgi:hypothetical protein
MFAFFDWLIRKDAAADLRLLEHAAYFDPQAYNQVFESELEKLLHRVFDPNTRQQVMALRGFDWGGYLARSSLRAGLKNDDQQEACHQIAVKLLVSPGRLFSGWQPERHGPLDRRFRASVWNALRNLIEKDRNRQRWMRPADPAVMADRLAGRAPYSPSSLIDAFRQLVGERLGALALAILDQRLEGRDTKKVVGRADLGSPSAHAIKREVGEIKDLARRYAAAVGDPVLLAHIERLMASEERTVQRRQATMKQRAGVVG